jgi:TRAP-type C4-dicarboxylate transport system permease small subunit
VPRLLLRLENALAGLEAALAVFGLMLMLLLAFVQLIARNFFDTGFPTADTLLRYLVLLVSFLGAVMAVREQRHIKIDLLVVSVPEKWRPWLDTLLSLISAAVCGTLCWAAGRFWRTGWQVAAPTEKWVAALALILPISFGLLCLEFALRALVSAPATKGR